MKKRNWLGRFAAVTWLVLLIATCVWASFSVDWTTSYATSGGSGTGGALGSSAQTGGHTIILFSTFCMNNSCGSAGCNAAEFQDDQNDSYTFDVQAVTATLCADIGHAANIKGTGSAGNVYDYAGTVWYQAFVGASFSGLGSSPQVSGKNVASSTTTMNSIATTTACNAGDLAVAIYSSSGGVTGPGGAWNTFGSPPTNYWVGWETVPSTGVVTLNVTGTSGNTGAGIECLTPDSSHFYPLPAPQPGVAGGGTVVTFPTSSAAGDTIFGGVGWCLTGSGCASGACTLASFSDNAGSVGGSGNNTYVVDQGGTPTNTGCMDMAHAANIHSTTSGLNFSSSVSGTINNQNTFGFEIGNAGSAPIYDSSAISNGNVTSISTNCTAGDFVWVFSPDTNSTSPYNAGGQGWTMVDKPSNGQVAYWETAPATGTLTVGVPSQRAGIACYKPGNGTVTTQAWGIIARLLNPFNLPIKRTFL